LRRAGASAVGSGSARAAGHPYPKGGTRTIEDVGELWICDLGVVPYADALELQEGLRAARQDGAIPDVLLMLEHPPVYTRGRRTRDGELPFDESFYAQRGIEIVD